MLNCLKFFPFRCRTDHYPEQIVGPYFSKLLTNFWKFGDSCFYFSAPLSNPVFAFFGDAEWVERVDPKRRDILNSEWSLVYGLPSGAPPFDWDRQVFYSNRWYFVGPWFAGSQANLSFNALLLSPRADGKFSSKSLLHPRVFEAAVTDVLDKIYGYSKTGKKPKYRGPLLWRILNISDSIQAIACDVHEIGNGSKENPLLHRLVYFPVTKDRFVQLNFNFGGTQIYKDEVRAKPLFELCDSIISSFRLEVGPQTQAQWDEVKESCPDMSLAETMGEFQWPLEYEKPSNQKPEKDITPTLEVLEHRAK